MFVCSVAFNLAISVFSPASSHAAGCVVTGQTVFVDPTIGCDLQTAFAAVPNGGALELRTDVVHNAPQDGFKINNIGKSFSIRGANGGVATLSGQHTQTILRYNNSDLSRGGPITFERLLFVDGYSALDGFAGGVSMHHAQATFNNCTFRGNTVGAAKEVGGGLLIVENAHATINDSLFEDNSTPTYGGAIHINGESSATIVRSRFLRNRTNPANHFPYSGGGAIFLNNPTRFSGPSSLTVVDSVFENNVAGYVGGAIYIIANFTSAQRAARAQLNVQNSIFTNNRSERDPTVVISNPTEAGAIMVEDDVQANINYSQFIDNSANLGGVLSAYRSNIHIQQSYFKGNKATGVGAGLGAGGAIFAHSNDTSFDGSVNAPSAVLSLQDSLIWGGGKVAQAGGGVMVAGDAVRAYGITGLPILGTPQSNRAHVFITNTVMYDLDVQEQAGAGGTGIGGAFVADLADVTLQNVLIARADAFGANNSSGGAIAIINNSKAQITNSNLFYNTVDHFGGGIFVLGSQIDIADSKLVGNDVSPGISETVSASYGSVLLAATEQTRKLSVIGVLQNNLIQNNIGLPFLEFDSDTASGEINDLRYNANTIFSKSFGDTIFSTSLGKFCCKSVTQLNTLVIDRTNAADTPKSQVPNTAPTAPQPAIAIQAFPPTLLSSPAIGQHNDASLVPAMPMFVAYAFDNTTRTLLNNQPLTNPTDLVSVSKPGAYTLSSGNISVTASILALQPKAFLPILLR